jgi:hypothetical protein
MQLVKENHKIAEYYKGRSVAELNSVDVSWDMVRSSLILMHCSICNDFLKSFPVKKDNRFKGQNGSSTIFIEGRGG